MADRVEDRLARLDRLTMDVTLDLWISPAGASPLDRHRWYRASDLTSTYYHFVRLARPNILDLDTTWAPDEGYVPVLHSIADGVYISRHEFPNAHGRTNYSVCRFYPWGAGPFGHDPLLQVLDLHIMDSTFAPLNVLRLLREYDAQLVGAEGDVSRYQAVIRTPTLRQVIDFELNSRGTPAWLRSSMYLGDSQEPIVREQFTLATMDVNGAELPSETIVSVRNPAVTKMFGHQGIHHILITRAEVDPALTPQTVSLAVDLRNAQVREVGPDGSEEVRYYDENGNVVRTISLGGPTDAAPHEARPQGNTGSDSTAPDPLADDPCASRSGPAAGKTASALAAGVRTWVPVAALPVGVTAAAFLGWQSWQAARRGR